MRGLNKAYLIGTIGQDPELKDTPSGKQLLKLSLVTPNARKVGDEWVDVPDWHRLTLWDGNAAYVTLHGRKGDTMAVECSIRPNKWTDKDNIVHHEVNLVVDRVLWLKANGRQQSETTAPMPPASPVNDDDILF